MFRVQLHYVHDTDEQIFSTGLFSSWCCFSVISQRCGISRGRADQWRSYWDRSPESFIPYRHNRHGRLEALRGSRQKYFYFTDQFMIWHLKKVIRISTDYGWSIFAHKLFAKTARRWWTNKNGQRTANRNILSIPEDQYVLAYELDIS